jgi:demethylmenaquinone methyltransferase / 2-methoxy-6-polyprenyl-1,4-benzoquinol methylase
MRCGQTTLPGWTKQGLDVTEPVSTETTHFGYATVPVEDKAAKVRGVFDSVARNYDVMNDLMSGGLHRLWKRFAVEACGLRAGEQVLDLAGGTGDIAKLMAKAVGPTGRVVLSDINAAMLGVGRDRLTDAGVSLPITVANAECLPFPSRRFDCVTIGFGLRNVTHKDRALAEMRRVLKPGGRAIVLEFSQPNALLAKPYDLYSFKLLPKIGKWVAKDEASYQYLAESIRMHPNQAALGEMMTAAGFDRVEWFNLAGGVVAVHRGLVF